MSKILIFLLFIPLLLCSQEEEKDYYGVAEIPIKPIGVYRFDSLSYTIIDVVDMQDSNSVLGELYIGMLNHHVLWYVKDGISKCFMKYFKKSLRYVECGDRKIVVAFRKYSLNEKEENLGVRGGRLRNYEIEVEYYESTEDDLVYLYTDHRKVDSLSNNSRYNIQKFTSGFFKTSLPGLDQFLKNNPNVDEKAVESFAMQEKNDGFSSINYDTNSTKLELNYVKIEPKGIPKVHFITGFERFAGTNANGFRLRYFGFQREWDSLKWVGIFSIDIEGTILNRSFGNADEIYDVDYSYFALGFGAVKPLNNYFFMELSAKVAFGREKIYFDPFYRRSKTNPLIGAQLNQRIHFMLGKGFGLILSAGMYENFYPTTEFLKTDFGFSFGGGIKF